MRYEELTSKTSKHWTMNITLNDLLKNSNDEILFCINNKVLKEDVIYGKYCIFINTHDSQYIKIGICDDGFAYSKNEINSDTLKTSYITFPMSAENALKFMWFYRNKVLNIKED